MGKSLLAGLVRGGRDADDLAVFDRSAEHPRTLAERYGARQVEAEEGAASAEAVLLVVPPKPVPSLPARIAPVLRPECLVLSLAAGLPTGEVERALRTGTPAVRVIPNTAVEVGQGMCVLSGAAMPDRTGPPRRAACSARSGPWSRSRRSSRTPPLPWPARVPRTPTT
ncbi:pyrroline-5-carboxylate reductase [Streptomyces sp. NBC_01789]|nr:NAD(P)-binding domain-containing protein [Streptomyces sp. NBC_01789]MCX4444883.1 NAD(P)-binding domain-containing protein [Streptomyces sp. NBC_01789]